MHKISGSRQIPCIAQKTSEHKILMTRAVTVSLATHVGVYCYSISDSL